jgi:hypothetical protein
MNTNNTHTDPPDEQPMLPFDPPIEFDRPANDVPQAPDVDALIAENESLRQEVRERDARDEISELLRSAGARSPELMFEAAKSDLQFADDGRLANAEALIGRLRAKFPEQFGSFVPQPAIDGGAGTIPAAILTKEALSKMKPADIARLNWDDVREVLSA